MVDQLALRRTWRVRLREGGVPPPPPSHLVLDFFTPIPRSQEIPEEITRLWQENIIANARRDFEHWKVIAGHPDTWASNLAIPANKAYRGFLKPGAMSRTGKTTSHSNALHLVNFLAGHPKAQAAWEAMFTNDAAQFSTTIEATGKNYHRGTPRPNALVGNREDLPLGKIVVHALIIAGETKIQHWLGEGDIFSGTIHPTTPYIHKPLRGAWKAASINLLVQAGYFIIRGVSPIGFNTRLDALLNTFLDPAYARPPTSFVHYELNKGILYLHTHIQALD